MAPQQLDRLPVQSTADELRGGHLAAGNGPPPGELGEGVVGLAQQVALEVATLLDGLVNGARANQSLDQLGADGVARCELTVDQDLSPAIEGGQLRPGPDPLEQAA